MKAQRLKKQLVELHSVKKSCISSGSPLSNQQQEIMKDLLESVQTNRLESQFEKYLPTVIDGEAPEKAKKAKLTEGKKKLQATEKQLN